MMTGNSVRINGKEIYDRIVSVCEIGNKKVVKLQERGFFFSEAVDVVPECELTVISKEKKAFSIMLDNIISKRKTSLDYLNKESKTEEYYRTDIEIGTLLTIKAELFINS